LIHPDRRCPGLSSSVALIHPLNRWSGWRKLAELIIGHVSHRVEELTAIMLDARIFEVIAELQQMCLP